MPLWNVYCAEGIYSADDKRGLAEAITDAYAAFGLPRFYAVVVFTEAVKDSLFVGGVPRDDFIRLRVDHIARYAAAEERERLLKFISKKLHPFIKDRGLSWEIHIDETPRDLWTVQGIPPPAEGSDEEQRWALENRPSKSVTSALA